MVKGKIGAIIALDGEKEFKQAVTDCNKSLSTLKSEMALVKAESEGQANTLEALQKKHSVLSRVLEEQERKQEAVADGLEHAKISYDKVGSGLVELREKLSSATDALEEMGKSSDATEEELKQQEKVVKELADAVAKGEKNYQSAGNRVKDWEAKLNTAKAQVIKANAEVNKNAAYMKEAETATDHCATSIDEFGKAAQKATEVTRKYSEVIKDNLVNTAADAIKGMATEAMSSITELEDAANQMQASTGASANQMKNYKAALEGVYANNYGDSLESVAADMGKIKQYTNETDPSKLQEMTESAIAMSDVFDMDLSETIRGADSLVQNMGLDMETAFDYMAKGAQNGLDKSGELADNIAEYSQLWGQAGFSAQEMFTILQNGLDSGAYNLDKVNDFVKEFSISLADGRIEDNIGGFSEKTGNLFYAWKQGRVTTKEVFNSVIDDLGTMTNKQDALTLASTVWSALGEDNAMSVITSLNKVNNTYDEVKGTMASIKDIKYDSLTNKWEELSRKFQMEIAVPVAEDFLPIAEAGLDALIDNMDLMVPVIAGIGTAVAEVKLASTFGLALSPVTLVGGALIAGAAALVTYADNAGEASQKIQDLVTANDKVVESSNSIVSATDETISEYDNTMATIEARGEYAQTLADRIETLAGKTGRSNAETSVMKQYISQLNEMVPGLNLAYDEQTKSLTKTNEQLEDYIKNSQKQLEFEAAEQYRKDIIQKRMDLEIEEIKLQNELKDLNSQKESLDLSDNEKFILYSMNSVEAFLTGNADKKKSYDELTEAIEENQESTESNQKAQEEVEEETKAVEQVLKHLEEQTGNTTQATETNTQAVENNRIAIEEQAAKKERARKEEELYGKAMEEATAQVVQETQKQINIFGKATTLTGEELRKATDETLENMKSQMTAMENWATNLQTISERGINDGLLKYLAEMGPNGAQYVAQFASMTNDEIDLANKRWNETMENAGIGAKIAGELTGHTQELADKLYKEYSAASDDAVAGFVDGLEAGNEKIEAGGAAVGDASVKGVRGKDGLDTGSPSKKMIAAGADASAGLAQGILSRILDVITASKTVAISAVTGASNIMSPSVFESIGISASASLAQGLLEGRGMVADAALAIGKTVVQGVRASLDMHSPSTVLIGLGEQSAESYGIGFEKQMKYVQAAVNDSMRFTATESQGAGTSMTSTGMSDLIENALYNGMLNAMSRIKIENNLSDINVNVTFGTSNLVEVLQGAADEHMRRNNSCIFNRG